MAGHRYEDEHRRPVPADTPFVDERVPQNVIAHPATIDHHDGLSHRQIWTGEKTTADPDVLAAIVALAGTYKTLQSGLFYERVPEIAVQRDLYQALSTFLNEAKQKFAESGNSAACATSIFSTSPFFFTGWA